MNSVSLPAFGSLIFRLLDLLLEALGRGSRRRPGLVGLRGHCIHLWRWVGIGKRVSRSDLDRQAGCRPWTGAGWLRRRDRRSDRSASTSFGVPVSTTRPLTMTAAVSATSSTAAANCSTTRMVTPVGRDGADGLVQLVDDQRRQTHRQLVEQQHARVAGDGPGDGQHLLLAAGHRAGHLGAPLGQAREVRERPLLDLLAAQPAVGHHLKVFLHGQVREDAPALGNGAHAGAGECDGIDPVDPAAAEEHVAGGGRVQPARRHAASSTCRRRSDRARRPHRPPARTRSTPCSTSMAP